MAYLNSMDHGDSAPSDVQSVSRLRSLLKDIFAFESAFFKFAFNPYRPELHYMRGPGPACAAKAARGAK